MVVEGTDNRTLRRAAGHIAGTAAVPGRPGDIGIAAHRDTQFRFLGELEPGDDIAATTAGGRRNIFRVMAMHIVRADASGLDPLDKGPTGSRLALVTCYPFTGVLHSKLRYVVLADRVGAP